MLGQHWDLVLTYILDLRLILQCIVSLAVIQLELLPIISTYIDQCTAAMNT